MDGDKHHHAAPGQPVPELCKLLAPDPWHTAGRAEDGVFLPSHVLAGLMLLRQQQSQQQQRDPAFTSVPSVNDAQPNTQVSGRQQAECRGHAVAKMVEQVTEKLMALAKEKEVLEEELQRLTEQDAEELRACEEGEALLRWAVSAEAGGPAQGQDTEVGHTQYHLLQHLLDGLSNIKRLTRMVEEDQSVKVLQRALVVLEPRLAALHTSLQQELEAYQARLSQLQTQKFQLNMTLWEVEDAEKYCGAVRETMEAVTASLQHKSVEAAASREAHARLVQEAVRDTQRTVDQATALCTHLHSLSHPQ